MTVCGVAQMTEWLVRERLVKNTSDLANDLVAELFRVSKSKLACPQCGHVGIIAEPSQPIDDEMWGGARKCEVCGASISQERIDALPDVRLCVACQGRDDRGEATGPEEYCPRCGNIMNMALSRGGGIARYVMTCPACRR
jgi:RNA polymerase-binding transcription factor DksA